MTQIEDSHKRNQIEFSVCPTSLRSSGVLMAVLNETDLYGPVKELLEQQGYAVKGEVDRCDLVAVRGAEPPVIVELKRRFALSVVYQCIERQRITDAVYLAIAPPTGRKAGGRCGTAIAEPCCSSAIGSGSG